LSRCFGKCAVRRSARLHSLEREHKTLLRNALFIELIKILLSDVQKWRKLYKILFMTLLRESEYDFITQWLISQIVFSCSDLIDAARSCAPPVGVEGRRRADASSFGLRGGTDRYGPVLVAVRQRPTHGRLARMHPTALRSRTRARRHCPLSARRGPKVGGGDDVFCPNNLHLEM